MDSFDSYLIRKLYKETARDGEKLAHTDGGLAPYLVEGLIKKLLHEYPEETRNSSLKLNEMWEVKD